MILAINVGSSSLKFSLFPKDDLAKPRATGAISRIGHGQPVAALEAEGDHRVLHLHAGTHESAAVEVIGWLGPRLFDENTILVGHRVVHGGLRTEHALIDGNVEKAIESAAAFAPLHNPPALRVIRAVRQALGAGTPMVAVFDTAFFADLPELASRYPVPWQMSERYGIRRYGFHGLAHEAMAHIAAEVIGQSLDHLTVVTLQLGNGCSAALVVKGRAIDTSMGLTPLEGLMMGTRSGSIDPAIVAFVAEREGVSAQGVVDILNSRSGLLGVSGVSADWRDLERAAADGNGRAEIAIGMFAYRVRKQIGAYFAAAAGPVDAIVFGGGIGEHSAALRRLVLNDLGHLGVSLDASRNDANRSSQPRVVSSADSPTAVLVAHVDEMKGIARSAVMTMKSVR